MRAAKLPSLCFQFPSALLFFLFSLRSDEDEFLDVSDDTGFTVPDSISFSHNGPNFSLSFLPFFLTVDPEFM